MCVSTRPTETPEYWNSPEAIFADNIIIFTDNFQKEFMVQLETFTKSDYLFKISKDVF